LLGIDGRAARYTWTAAMVLLVMWVVYLTRHTLFVFTIALMFAYLLYPLLDGIERRISRKTRTPALALTFVIVMATIALFVAFIGNSVGGQAAELALQVRSPDFAKQVKSWQILGLPVGAQIAGHYDYILGKVPEISLRVLSASSNLIYLAIIPILSFFILKDGRAILAQILDLFATGREAAQDTLDDAHTLLLQYMRALLFLCLSTLIVFSVVLSLLQVPYAILLATIAFPLEFVPLVGPLIAAAFIVGVSAFTGYPHVLVVLAFLASFRIFQDYFLSPHLMSRGVELHPLLVIFGVFAGEEIGGVAGVFLSVPVLALMRLGWHHLRKRKVSAA
jgi:predicted PurR-regulated permease PerM